MEHLALLQRMSDVPHFLRFGRAFQAGFGPHAQEIMADIPNYTDQTPVIQISEVVVGN